MSYTSGREGKLLVVSEKPDESAAWLPALEGSLQVVVSASASVSWQFLPSDRARAVVLQLIAPRSHAPQLISTLRTHAAFRGVPYYVLVGDGSRDARWASGFERVELVQESEASRRLPELLLRDRREDSRVQRVSGRMPTHRLDQALRRAGLERPPLRKASDEPVGAQRAVALPTRRR